MRICVMLLLSLVSVALAQSPESVTTELRNPFAPPALPAAQPSSGSTRAKPTVERIPKLHAVLAAGEKSIANLEGQVIAIGEQYRGYRLVSVVEDTAVFRRNGRTVTLSVVKAPAAERDEPVMSSGRGSSNERE